MHYNLALISKEPVNTFQISKMLSRFRDDFLYKIIGQSEEEEDDEVCLLSIISKEDRVKYFPIDWDWLTIGGRWNNYIDNECNVKRISKIKNKNIEFHAYFNALTEEVGAKKAYDGEEFIENLDYQSSFDKQLEDNQDCYLTILDMHY